jgi:4-amino-4-deoxy-L-arabinose transferase-like glycosyltransferase
MLNRNLVISLLILVGGCFLFIPFLGSVHLFDWDEINFAECAREMIVTGNYSQVQINFQPFWEKPPLFIWMQAISMNLFGVNEFAARFPNALCGIFTLLILFNIGKKIYDEKFALIWVLVYASSFLTFFYFKTGIIDPWFNLFIFIGIYYAILFTNNPEGEKNYLYLFLSGAFIGLSVLTKGPVGLLIFGLTAFVFLLLKRFRNTGKLKHFLVFLVSFSLVGLSWFIIEILKGNTKLVFEFINYQIRLLNTKDSGHGGFILYHVVVLLIGCFPASVFFFTSLKKSYSDTPYQIHVKKWMSLLFWIVLILFTIVKTKIVHYSSMCWLPLTYLSAHGIYKILTGENKVKKWVIHLGILLTCLFGITLTIIPLIDHLKTPLINSNIIQDKFALENLKANGNWLGFEWIFGILFLTTSLLFLVKIKKGNYSSILNLFYSSLLTIFLASIFIVPKIERYVQGAAIDFYKEIKNQDCYLETAGFKSYAYLFYSNKKPNQNTPELLDFAKKIGDKEEKEGLYDPMQSFARYSVIFICDNNLSKPAYIVLKCNNEFEFTNRYPEFKKLYSKNGFVFLKKMPSHIKNKNEFKAGI